MKTWSRHYFAKKGKAAEAGRRGGPAVLEKYGRNHFVELAKKRWAKERELSTSGVAKEGQTV